MTSCRQWLWTTTRHWMWKRLQPWGPVSSGHPCCPRPSERTTSLWCRPQVMPGSPRRSPSCWMPRPPRSSQTRKCFSACRRLTSSPASMMSCGMTGSCMLSAWRVQVWTWPWTTLRMAFMVVWFSQAGRLTSLWASGLGIVTSSGWIKTCDEVTSSDARGSWPPFALEGSAPFPCFSCVFEPVPCRLYDNLLCKSDSLASLKTSRPFSLFFIVVHVVRMVTVWGARISPRSVSIVSFPQELFQLWVW